MRPAHESVEFRVRKYSIASLDRYIFSNRNCPIQNTVQQLSQGHLIGRVACLPQGPKASPVGIQNI